MSLPWHLYAMALLYIAAGLNHFRTPKLYHKIIPPYIPNPKIVNLLTGSAEIILGILLLFPHHTKVAAWGIIILLIAVFPANLYMYQNEKASLNLPAWMRLIRLPIQLLLLLWAYQYT